MSTERRNTYAPNIERQDAHLPDTLLENLEEKVEEQGFLTLSDIDIALADADSFKQEEIVEIKLNLFDHFEDEEVKIIGKSDSDEVRQNSFQAEEYISELPESLRAYDSVGLYFAQTGEVPLLSREEEVELAKTMEKGKKAKEKLDEDNLNGEARREAEAAESEGLIAREHLIAANTRLVVSVAKKYKSQGEQNGLEFNDLIQEGNIGLIKAIDKYEWQRGYKVSTYSTWWIRQSILRALKNQGRTIRVSVHATDTLRRIYKEIAELEQRLGRRPDLTEIAERFYDMDEEKIEKLLVLTRRPKSLDKPVRKTQGDMNKESDYLENFISDDNLSPEEEAARKALGEAILEAIDTLPIRQAQILRLRFGIGSNKPLTLEEVSKKFDLTRERIRQLEGIAIRHIRNHPRAGELAEFLDEIN